MIALDVLGGDFAPHASIRGALRAARNAIPVLLVGPEARIISLLDEFDKDWRSYPISIEPANDFIAMGEHPAMAIRKKPDASLVRAVSCVGQHKARGIVSAGNSGALMVAAMHILGCDEGIERPAIAGFIPSKKGQVLCLDLGANVDCKPRYLLSFAHLAHNYLQNIHHIISPKVGLLSNGTEPEKGSQLVREAHALLAASSLNFVGNVEPAALFDHAADIIVCDGFAGNILLKTLESTSAFLDESCSLPLSNVGRLDWKTQGGALLLGVSGTVVVAHGCSDEIAIENALRRAYESSIS